MEGRIDKNFHMAMTNERTLMQRLSRILKLYLVFERYIIESMI
jgi:hypothetical protein